MGTASSTSSGGMSRTDVLRASPPIFGNGALDRLTRVHPAVPALIFLPAVGVLAGLAVGAQAVSIVLVEGVSGYVFWTLTEYWAHRAVFHFEPTRGPGVRLHWMIHGVHHDHPNDPRRLVLPPVLSLPLAALFYGSFVAVLGTPVAWGACAGFFAGYLIYDTVHFVLHHTHPRSGLGRRLRELHMRHHFEDDERGFGVSVPYWDIVFGTYSGRRRDASSRRAQ
jgi:dihydroceramide fatty acyl 2-hydroxylase